jgi:hypothetical protein
MQTSKMPEGLVDSLMVRILRSTVVPVNRGGARSDFA